MTNPYPYIKLKALFFGIGVCVSLAAQASTLVTECWSATVLDPYGNPYPRRLRTDTHGNTYILSDVSVPNHTYFDITKYGPYGNFVWKSRLSQSFASHAVDLGIDTNGNVYITVMINAGSVLSTGLYKLTPYGNFVFARTLVQSASTGILPLALGIDASNNVYLACGNGYGAGGSDLRIVKYSPAGALLLRQDDTTIYPSEAHFDASCNCLAVGIDGHNARVSAYLPSAQRAWTQVSLGYQDTVNHASRFPQLFAQWGAAGDAYVGSDVDLYSDATGRSYTFQVLRYNLDGSLKWTSPTQTGALRALTVGSPSDVYISYDANPQSSQTHSLLKVSGTGGIYFHELLRLDIFAADTTLGVWTVNNSGPNGLSVMDRINPNGALSWAGNLDPANQVRNVVDMDVRNGLLTVASVGQVGTGNTPGTFVSRYVTGVALSSVQAPNTKGGQQGTGTVTLNSAAGASGVVVSLFSDNAALKFGSGTTTTVTVLPGHTTVQFQFSTVAVSSTQIVAITAESGYVKRQATLSVTP